MNDTDNRFYLDVWKSISSFDYYVTIPHKTVSKALRFLISLLLIYVTVIMLVLVPRIIKEYSTYSNWLIEHLPEGEITNGEIAFHGVKEPYKASEGTTFILEIDTKNPAASFDPEYPFAMVIKKDRILLKGGKFIKEYVFPDTLNFTVNRKNIVFLRNIIIVFTLLYTLFMNVLYVIVVKTVQSFIFAGIAWLYVRMKRFVIPFLSLWKISLYAITAPIILSLAVIFIGRNPPFYWLMYMSVYLIFIIGGVSALLNAKVLEE